MKNEIIKRILSSAIILPTTLFFVAKGSIYFIFFLAIFFLITSYEWLRMTKNKLLSFLGVFFLFITTYTAYLLRGNEIYDLFIFLFVIIICISTDIGGYVFGKIFKGPKLIKISPNKTYSGMIGSFLLSLFLANFYQNELYKLNLIADLFFKNEILLLIFILLISLISQLGDLLISYFKRLSKIKNTGIILPGHGGLLDRVDGIIFAIPFAYIIFKLI